MHAKEIERAHSERDSRMTASERATYMRSIGQHWASHRQYRRCRHNVWQCLLPYLIFMPAYTGLAWHGLAWPGLAALAWTALSIKAQRSSLTLSACVCLSVKFIFLCISEEVFASAKEPKTKRSHCQLVGSATRSLNQLWPKQR